MGVDEAGVVAYTLGEGTFNPSLYVFIVKGVGHTQDVSRCVLGVVVDTVLFKVTVATRFKIYK